MLGRIPANRLYQPGLAILNMWPLPTSSTIVGTNLQFIRPAEDTLSYQPADPLRLSGACRPCASATSSRGSSTRHQVTQGSIPGWNDALNPFPGIGTDAVSVNYNLNPTMFLEGTFGRAWNKQGNLFQINPISDSRTSGLAALPAALPGRRRDSSTELLHLRGAEQGEPAAPYWDGTRVWNVPEFAWGNRIASGARRPTSR